MYHNDPSSSLLLTKRSCSSVVPSTIALKLELTRCRPVSFLEASLRALSCFSPAFGVSADDARAATLRESSRVYNASTPILKLLWRARRRNMIDL